MKIAKKEKTALLCSNNTEQQIEHDLRNPQMGGFQYWTIQERGREKKRQKKITIEARTT